MHITSETHRAAIVHHADFALYDFGPHHPLRPERINAGLDLLRACHLWEPDQETLCPAPASRDELQLVHDGEFVRVVEDAASAWIPRDLLARHGLTTGDNPPFPQMHYASSLVAGGTVAALRAILSGTLDHAFNPAGGLHHAMRSRASGFCIYNDPAIACAVACKEFGARVLYLDFDCHHGDGVQSLFYREPMVMTVSFHESGRYLFPGTGFLDEQGEGAGRGYCINVPFEPYTCDSSWLAAVVPVMQRATDAFRPDVMISSHGADTHALDPLTHLALSTASFRTQATLVHELAHAYCNGRWLGLGSGGYDWRRVVPRSWAILWSVMTGREIPLVAPEAWARKWQDVGNDSSDRNFLDPPDSQPTSRFTSESLHTNQRTTEQALGLLAMSSG